MITKIRTIAQIAIVAAALAIASPAKAQSITPQSQPNCMAIACTMDGSTLPETTTITPEATITESCNADGCASSWVPNETDESAIGVEPQVFVIPESDR